MTINISCVHSTKSQVKLNIWLCSYQVISVEFGFNKFYGGVCFSNMKVRKVGRQRAGCIVLGCVYLRFEGF